MGKILALNGGPFNGKQWLTKVGCGTFIFTVRGVKGYYDRHGQWKRVK